MTSLKIPKRSFKQKKWQCNAHNKRDKRTDNDLHRKLKTEQHESD